MSCSFSFSMPALTVLCLLITKIRAINPSDSEFEFFKEVLVIYQILRFQKLSFPESGEGNQ